jgi:protocatechuate 3,4-dioxygenase beta subunit
MKQRFSRVLTMIAMCAFVALIAATASAQTSRGIVSGTVTDTNGAVVTGANVTLTNTETTISRTVDTSDSGFYRFDAVDLGTYSVTIIASGFGEV